jgi:hypothetical protein
MPQLLGILSICLGLLLLARLVMLFIVSRWQDGCIAIGTTIIAYEILSRSLPVFFAIIPGQQLLPPEAVSAAFDQMLVLSQITMLCSYIIGLMAVSLLNRLYAEKVQ